MEQLFNVVGIIIGIPMVIGVFLLVGIFFRTQVFKDDMRDGSAFKQFIITIALGMFILLIIAAFLNK